MKAHTANRIDAIKARIAEFNANEKQAIADGRFFDAGRCKEAAYWLQWAVDVWEADTKDTKRQAHQYEVAADGEGWVVEVFLNGIYQHSIPCDSWRKAHDLAAQSNWSARQK